MPTRDRELGNILFDRPGAAPYLFASTTGALCAEARHRRLWRSNRAGRLHVSRLGGATPLDQRSRLQRRAGFGPAHARSAGGAVGDVSRLRSLPERRSDIGRHRVLIAIVRGGVGARLALCPLATPPNPARRRCRDLPRRPCCPAAALLPRCPLWSYRERCGRQ